MPYLPLIEVKRSDETSLLGLPLTFIVIQLAENLVDRPLFNQIRYLESRDLLSIIFNNIILDKFPY
jgi:hypothetical protein